MQAVTGPGLRWGSGTAAGLQKRLPQPFIGSARAAPWRPVPLDGAPAVNGSACSGVAAPSRQRLQHATVCQSAAAGAMAMPAGEEQATAAPPSTLWSNIRALLFFLWSVSLAFPLFLSMLVMAPAVTLLDNSRRLAQHFCNFVWAKFSTGPFMRVEIEGRENLPSKSTPAVYVANHQSFLDIYSLFHLNRPFKFISKTSNFLIPVVGWSMFLTGHVMLNRVDRRSQIKCLGACIDLLKAGASVLFFPEGTRSLDMVMADFKKGAFSVATKAGAVVVPVTILGSGALMPSGREKQLSSGTIRLVVHPIIPTKGRDADVVAAEARAVIAASLPAALRGETQVAPPPKRARAAKPAAAPPALEPEPAPVPAEQPQEA